MKHSTQYTKAYFEKYGFIVGVERDTIEVTVFHGQVFYDMTAAEAWAKRDLRNRALISWGKALKLCGVENILNTSDVPERFFKLPTIRVHKGQVI